MASFKSTFIWYLLKWTGYKKWWPMQVTDVQAARSKNKLVPPAFITKKFNCESVPVQGGLLYHISNRNHSSANHVLYIHGGAYIRGPLIQHWQYIQRLITHCEVSVSLVIYPKTPEHHFRQVYDFIQRCNELIIKHYSTKNISWMGDSSGAALVMGLAQLAQNKPKQLILLFPWLDITLQNPKIEALEIKDPILSSASLIKIGGWFSNDEDKRYPLLSPLYANLSGWPSVHIIAGTYDIFYPDIVAFHANQTEKENAVHLYPFEKMIHGFTHINIPEASQAMNIMKNLLG